MENKKLILNIEYFLQCAGNCAGCFLTRQERESSQVFNDLLADKVKQLLSSKIFNQGDEIIIGFGRGNILNLSIEELDLLLGLMSEIEKEYGFLNIKYEVSTSLIGKISNMIDRAKYLINNNAKIYFNIVINSEIVSKNFWQNYQKFYGELSSLRKSWGKSDETGDILVLNINPEMLPNIEDFREYFQQDGVLNGSPFNVSVFPFVSNVNSETLNKLNQWVLELYLKTKDLDVNLRNITENVMKTTDFSSLDDIIKYHNVGKGVYYFIDKKGNITEGHFSTMGEVDYPRLVDKYSIDPDMVGAIKTLNKNRVCVFCEYKNVCLLTGAYLPALGNISLGAKSVCPNGYQSFFKQVASDLNAISS